MNKILLIAVLLFVTNFLIAQDEEAFRYMSSNEIDSVAEFPSWQYSFIGEYKKALGDDFPDWRMPKPLSEKDSVNFKNNYMQHSAREIILAKAKQHKIVMFNEAHNDPRHRVFLKNLLVDFKEMGYTHLGLETLYHQNQIYQRNYPCLQDGEYLIEPQMGNLIREALRLGITVFAYESEILNGIEPDTFGRVSYEEVQKESNRRDSVQTRNIEKIIIKNPSGKIIILAGFGHIKETYSPDWSTMAYNLKKWTNIDPLTIEQTKMTETGNKKFNSPYLNMENITYPSIFVHKENDSIFIEKELNYMTNSWNINYDLQVFHPIADYKKGRPSWLSNTKQKTHKIKCAIRKKIQYPALCFAYKNEENIDCSIPMDVIELKNKNDNKVLMINKSYKYNIIIIDSNNNNFKYTLK